jgi:hypothetical protein
LVQFELWFGRPWRLAAIPHSSLLSFFYCAACVRCCQLTIPRKQLVLLLALSDVSIVAIIFGFGAATAAANSTPFWSTNFGAAFV